MQIDYEELLHRARYARFDFMSKADRILLEQQLKDYGYTIEYGCCGRNILKVIPNERQSHIPTNE